MSGVAEYGGKRTVAHECSDRLPGQRVQQRLGAGQFWRQHGSDVGWCPAAQHAVPGDAGRVDDGVYLAESGHRGLYRLPCAGWGRNIGSDFNRVAAEAGSCPSRYQYQTRLPCGREMPRGGGAEAASRTGDDDDGAVRQRSRNGRLGDFTPRAGHPLSVADQRVRCRGPREFRR